MFFYQKGNISFKQNREKIINFPAFLFENEIYVLH